MATYTGMFGLGLDDQEERMRVADERNRNYAMQLARMSPDEAVSYQGVRGVQMAEQGLGGAFRQATGNLNANERMQAARQEIEARLRGQDMKDPLAAYPVIIEVLQKYGFVEEAMKAAKELEELQNKRRDDERAQKKDDAAASDRSARTELLKRGSPLMQAVERLGQLYAVRDGMLANDPNRQGVERQIRLIEDSLAKKNIQIKDAGDKLMVFVDGVAQTDVAKGKDPNKKDSESGDGWKTTTAMINGELHNVVIDKSGNIIKDLGPTDKQNKLTEADKATLESTKGKVRFAQAQIAAIKKRIRFDTIGTGAVATYKIPGTPAYDVARLLETLKARLGFEELKQMRFESPTGGALGQVSEKENVYLQNSLANLDQLQSAGQFKQQLAIIEEFLNDKLSGAEARLSARQPNPAPSAPATSPPPSNSGAGWSIRRK